MKSPRIQLWLVALGIAVIAVIWWRTSNRQADVKPPTPVVITTPRPESKPAVSASTALPSPEKTPAVRAQHSLSAETRAMVHEKTHQWLRSKTGDTETQERLLAEFAALLTDENVAAIIRELSAEEFDTPFSTKALERWLQTDPAQAARWIAARTDARDEHALLVARRLMETPAELHAYSDQLPDGTWKQSVLEHASLETIAKDPVTAVTFAQRMAPGDAQTNAFETIAYDWFGRDLAAAAQWTNSVSDPQLRERLLAVGAKAIANADPDLAAGWLVSSVKTEGVLNETALSVVETWADQHPMQAANWVSRFSEAGPRKEAIELVLSHWLKSDPASANAWIQTLPERDAVLDKLKAEEAERAKAPEKE